MKILSNIKSIARSTLILFKIFWYLAMYGARLFRYSFVDQFNSQPIAKRNRVLANLHVIEKGLTMKSRKSRFSVINNAFIKSYGEELQKSENTLSAENYLSFSIIDTIIKSQELVWDLQDKLKDDLFISKTLTDDTNFFSTKSNIAYDAEIITFLRNRKSVRFFDKKIPSENLIRECIATASRSPSACNRQSARYTYTTNNYIIQNILKLQTGNKGFGYNVPGLIIVSTTCSDALLPEEINQPIIDGCLGAMLLSLALNASGLGNVFLNWSVSRKKDRLLREFTNIPNDEIILFLIAFGYPDPAHDLSPPSPRMANQYFTRTI